MVQLKIIDENGELTEASIRTLNRDSRYGKLLRSTKSIKLLIDAGFLPEPEILKTSNQEMPILENGVILLLTGCFAPVHQGHIAALKSARYIIEKETGKGVVGGFLGMCHDDYVNEKTDKFPIDVRLEYFYKMNKEQWIYPYLWEAHQLSATNFTTVYSSLKNSYPKNTIVLVYGSDHPDFKYVINKNELQVCVYRHNSLVGACTEKDWPRLLKVNSEHPNESSRNIRKKLYG